MNDLFKTADDIKLFAINGYKIRVRTRHGSIKCKIFVFKACKSCGKFVLGHVIFFFIGVTDCFHMCLGSWS